MNKFLIFLAVFLVAIMSVSAAAELTMTDVALGGDNQERDTNTTATLTVTNTGNETATGIDLTSNFPSEYMVSFSDNNFDLAANTSVDVTVTGFVPETMHAVEEDGDEIKVFIETGLISADYGVLDAATSVLTMQAENNLEVRDVKITVNDDEDYDENDRIEVFPAAEIEIEIELKNTHDNFDIEDIEIIILNDDLDVDEDDEISKIKDGDKETITFTFKLDIDSDEDRYDVLLTIKGTDDENADHGEMFVLDFDLEEKGIFITEARLSSDTYVCGTEFVDLTVELSNVGDKDEDEAAVAIFATTMNNFKDEILNIEIDDKDEVTRTFRIPVTDNVALGRHVIQIVAYENNNDKTHEKFTYFSVPECSTQPEEEEEEEDDDSIDVIFPEDDDEEDDGFVDVGVGETDDKKDLEFDFEGDFWFTLLMILLNILVLVVIIILIVRFLF